MNSQLGFIEYTVHGDANLLFIILFISLSQTLCSHFSSDQSFLSQTFCSLHTEAHRPPQLKLGLPLGKPPWLIEAHRPPQLKLALFLRQTQFDLHSYHLIFFYFSTQRSLILFLFVGLVFGLRFEKWVWLWWCLYFFGLAEGFGFVGAWVAVGSGVAMGGWFCSPWIAVGLWDLGILAPGWWISV